MSLPVRNCFCFPAFAECPARVDVDVDEYRGGMIKPSPALLKTKTLQDIFKAFSPRQSGRPALETDFGEVASQK